MTAPTPTDPAVEDGAGPAEVVTTPESNAAPPAQPPGAARDADLVLARVHLRLGSLGLARTELETLAGTGGLDDDAIRDLAEARWRTGDVIGAGEAATAWLEGHGDDILGLVIAAEAQAALGRPGEARRLAGRALERADGSLDPIFAGMQRSAVWPAEPGAAGGGPVGVLFDDLHPGPLPVEPLGHGSVPGGWADDDGLAPDRFDAGGPAFGDGPSLWGDDAVLATRFDDDLEPADLLQRARLALEAGEVADAATGLILALRASPATAPAVLDLVAGRTEPILVLLRGDAQRIVGREREAIRDHSAAAGGLAAGSPPAPDGASDRRGGPAADDDDDRQPEPEPEPSQPDQETP